MNEHLEHALHVSSLSSVTRSSGRHSGQLDALLLCRRARTRRRALFARIAVDSKAAGTAAAVTAAGGRASGGGDDEVQTRQRGREEKT